MKDLGFRAWGVRVQSFRGRGAAAHPAALNDDIDTGKMRVFPKNSGHRFGEGEVLQ